MMGDSKPIIGCNKLKIGVINETNNGKIKFTISKIGGSNKFIKSTKIGKTESIIVIKSGMIAPKIETKTGKIELIISTIGGSNVEIKDSTSCETTLKSFLNLSKNLSSIFTAFKSASVNHLGFILFSYR